MFDSAVNHNGLLYACLDCGLQTLDFGNHAAADNPSFHQSGNIVHGDSGNQRIGIIHILQKPTDIGQRDDVFCLQSGCDFRGGSVGIDVVYIAV